MGYETSVNSLAKEEQQPSNGSLSRGGEAGRDVEDSNSETRSDSPTFPFEILPDPLNGWHREPGDDRTVVEYWRRGSTHVTGAYEKLAVRELSDGDLSCTRIVYDQFRHSISSTTLTRQGRDRAEWVAKRLRRETDRSPGKEGYDEPPAFPARVGVWSAVSRQHFDGADATRWVYDPEGEYCDTSHQSPWEPEEEEEEGTRPEFSLRETSIEGSYSYTGRYYTFRYRDDEHGELTLATDVPRTAAFEMAVYSLATLPAPLDALSETQEELTDVPGIGPAKSAKFILLGLTTPSALRDYLLAEGPVVNHHHRDRVEVLLTSRIVDFCKHTQDSKA